MFVRRRLVIWTGRHGFEPARESLLRWKAGPDINLIDNAVFNFTSLYESVPRSPAFDQR